MRYSLAPKISPVLRGSLLQEAVFDPGRLFTSQLAFMYQGLEPMHHRRGRTNPLHKMRDIEADIAEQHDVLAQRPRPAGFGACQGPLQGFRLAWR